MNGPARPVRSQLRSPQPGQTSTSQRPSQRDYREGGPGQQSNTRDFTPQSQLSTSAPRSLGSELRSRNRPPDEDLNLSTNSSRSQQQRPAYQQQQSDSRTDGSWTTSRGDPRDDDPNASPYDYDAYEEASPYEEVPPSRASPAVLHDALSAFERRGGRGGINGRESASPLMSDADGRELERRRQREKEKEKLQIIQDRQDRRAGKRKTTTGDIDGELSFFLLAGDYSYP